MPQTENERSVGTEKKNRRSRRQLSALFAQVIRSDLPFAFDQQNLHCRQQQKRSVATETRLVPVLGDAIAFAAHAVGQVLEAERVDHRRFAREGLGRVHVLKDAQGNDAEARVPHVVYVSDFLALFLQITS